MARTVLILLLLLSACVAVSSEHVALRAQLTLPWWVTAAEEAEIARHARCPNLGQGCFVGGDTCQTTICFCRRACEPGISVGRLWGGGRLPPCVCSG